MNAVVIRVILGVRNGVMIRGTCRVRIKARLILRI